MELCVCACVCQWQRRTGALTWLEFKRVGLILTSGECVEISQHALLACQESSIHSHSIVFDVQTLMPNRLEHFFWTTHLLNLVKGIYFMFRFIL